MAIIGNYSVLNKSLAQFTNGTATAGAYAAVTPSNYQKNGMFINAFGAFSAISSQPLGYRPPYAYRLAKSAGAIASQTQSSGAVSGAGTMYAGRNLEAASAMVITLTNAQLDQIISAAGSSSMAITATSAILAGAAGMTASGAGIMAVLDALCGAIFSVTASGSESISGTGTELTAIAHLEASAGGATPLSPEGLAASLLDNEDVETGYSLREAVRIILSATAGKVSGAETTTITFRNLPDDKNRIVATVDANGNRTAITYDVS